MDEWINQTFTHLLNPKISKLKSVSDIFSLFSVKINEK